MFIKEIWLFIRFLKNGCGISCRVSRINGKLVIKK